MDFVEQLMLQFFTVTVVCMLCSMFSWIQILEGQRSVIGFGVNICLYPMGEKNCKYDLPCSFFFLQRSAPVPTYCTTGTSPWFPVIASQPAFCIQCVTSFDKQPKSCIAVQFD